MTTWTFAELLFEVGHLFFLFMIFCHPYCKMINDKPNAYFSMEIILEQKIV